MIRTDLVLTLAFVVTTAAACSKSPAPAASGAPGAPAAPSSSGAPAAPASVAPDTGTIAGTVAETMNAGGYTYVRLQTAAAKDVWAAAPEMPVKTGEHLTMSISMPMENFHSKTLNRDFPIIYFVSDVARDGETLPAGGATPVPPLAGSHDAAPTAAPQVVEPIPPPAGGMKIADLWAKRKSLAGKTVVVRGKVVKVNNAIMGKNWFHVQDGSGTAKDGTNDLTITSNATVTLGDIVTVSGTLTIDKDFGAGYAYDAIIEDAKVTDIGKPANQ